MGDETARMLIDGRWTDGSSGITRDSVSPSSGARLGSYSVAATADVDLAVRAARRAQPAWGSASPFERAAVLHAAATAVRARHGAFARLLASENGKPLRSEAMSEIEWAANQLDEAAEWAVRVEGRHTPLHQPDEAGARPPRAARDHRRDHALEPPGHDRVRVPRTSPGDRQRGGVVPVLERRAVLVRARAAVSRRPAFRAGCSTWFPGRVPRWAAAIAGHPGVDLVGLTGSTATGDAVARHAVGRRVLLELGGNGPTIVLDDADVDLAAQAIAAGAFSNAGQSCSATELVLVHESLRAGLVERVVDLARGVVLGDPLDDATTMGPLHKEAVALQVEGHVAQAVAAGARVLTGAGGGPGPLRRCSSSRPSSSASIRRWLSRGRRPSDQWCRW